MNNKKKKSLLINLFNIGIKKLNGERELIIKLVRGDFDVLAS
jgi:hypothetical protein